MAEYISVRVVTLDKLFSGEYHFRLPFFQRAYAWQTPAVGRLLSNLVEVMARPAAERRYFLGKLMLAKREDNPDTALVDGHQRVMTLTILFAVLRDLEQEAAAKKRLASFIAGPDFRLSPQASLADFCARFVQTPGATEVEPEEDLADLSETERNIIENRNYLRAELTEREITAEARRALLDFLAESCLVIVSAVQDEEEAWRILRIEEETRVDFDESDRAKASLLSIVVPSDRAACQRVWEESEKLLGASDMHALLGHIRTLKLRKSSEKPVEIDIAQGFRLNVAGAGRAFFEREFLPAAQRLATLRRLQSGARERGQPIADCIERLSWIHTQLWVPAALLWLTRDADDASSRFFFNRLERLVWIMKVAGLDPTKQQRRIVELIGEIDRRVKASDMKELEIGRALRDAALSNLRSKTFDSKHYDARVLRRISIALGADSGPIHPEHVTIEHVLPRGWSPKGGWRKNFPTKKSVQAHAHMLGNLTFLSAAENRAAATLDWSEKRAICKRSKFILSSRLSSVADWSADAIKARTEELIRILFDAWELKV